MIIQANSAVINRGLVDSLWVEVEKGIISALSPGLHRAPHIVVTGTLIPGFIDIHCHGGGGHYFSASSDDEIRAVISSHRALGTTGVMASLVTESIEDLKRQIVRLVPFFHRNEIIGIHLEGPYLSHAQCGAHEPSLLREPDLDQIKELVALGDGAIAMITIAPELRGAPESITYIASQRVKVALGHTNADFKQAAVGANAGATVVTHFMNAMNKELSSDSFSAFILADERLMPELILDGHHLPFQVATDILKAIGSRCILISDAMAAAGSIDGDYTIGKLPVIVKDGIARLAHNKKLAGSTLSISQAFNNAIKHCGISLVDAVALSSTNPAKALSITDRGSIAVGMRADLLSYDSATQGITLVNSSE